MQLDRSAYEILQIIGISLTDKTHLRDLFDKSNFNHFKERSDSSEPNLFNLPVGGIKLARILFEIKAYLGGDLDIEGT